uniref:Expressed protein n=1 Tax=Oryza sativa subsp. japonica TaxID=39947 RepID=Q2QSL6_ORYSJ|nr:expressed protein [Oryza sativa Japonica Group]
MACCLWQDKSIEEIDKLRCAFFWKGEKSVKGGQCLVAWKTVLLQKQQQVLGIKDLRAHNTALVLKSAPPQPLLPSRIRAGNTVAHPTRHHTHPLELAKSESAPTFIQAVMDKNHSTSGIEPVESIST